MRTWQFYSVLFVVSFLLLLTSGEEVRETKEEQSLMEMDLSQSVDVLLPKKEMPEVVHSSIRNDHHSRNTTFSELLDPPKLIGSVQYKNGKINVYDGKGTRKDSIASNRIGNADTKYYYYNPIASIVHSETHCRLEPDTGRAEMKFSIEMWNADIQQQVLNLIQNEIGEKVENSQIRVMPHHTIMLNVTSPVFGQIHTVETLAPDQQLKMVNLSINMGADLQECHRYLNNMRNSPHHFFYRLVFRLFLDDENYPKQISTTTEMTSRVIITDIPITSTTFVTTQGPVVVTSSGPIKESTSTTVQSIIDEPRPPGPTCPTLNPCQPYGPVIYTNRSSGEQVYISTDVFETFTYKGYLIRIYQSISNMHSSFNQKYPTRYYYTPLVFLDHKNARTIENEFTGQIEMNFEIDLWNNDIQEKIYTLIKTKHDSSVTGSRIRMIPFEEVMLMSSSSAFQKQNLTIGDGGVVPYLNQKRNVTFSIVCLTLEKCKKLTKAMQETPEHFKSLRLLLRVTSEKTRTKEIHINVASIMAASLMSKLQIQMLHTEFVLLSKEDELALLSEMSSIIIRESFEDFETPSYMAEDKIIDFLRKHLLMESELQTTNRITDFRWDALFWNSDNHRPDKISKSLNEAFSKSGNKMQIIQGGYFRKDVWENKFIANLLMMAKATMDIKTKREKETSEESMKKFVQECRETIQWDGQQFVPKPLKVSRFDLAKLRDTHSFNGRSVQIPYEKANLEMTVEIPQGDEPDVPYLRAKIQRTAGRNSNGGFLKPMSKSVIFKEFQSHEEELSDVSLKSKSESSSIEKSQSGAFVDQNSNGVFVKTDSQSNSISQSSSIEKSSSVKKHSEVNGFNVIEDY